MILCSHRKMLGAAMAWRQGQSYSEDLRGRVLAAVDGGLAARAAARQTRKILPSTRGQREQNRRGNSVKLLTEAVILTPLDQDYDTGRRDPASRRP